MRVPRFFHAQPLAASQTVLLSPETSHHLLKVLRFKPGQALQLFDGSGWQFNGQLAEAEGKLARVSLQEGEQPQVESPLVSHLGLVMSKGDRMDYGIQKAVELGVHRISPLDSKRCELRLASDRKEKKQQHWQQVARSACEQSGRVADVPVALPQALLAWLQALPPCAPDELRLVLHPKAAKAMASLARPKQLLLLVGPEGGLDPEEIDLAHQHGFVSTLVGPRVLRTETAPLVALSLAQSLWGDF